MQTFLDFTFLRSLPTAQVRNGFAEIIKISSCAHLPTFDLLDKYCEPLIESAFGRLPNEDGDHLKEVADKINKEAIHVMLKLETPNLHEIGLDRIIAYGHTWSPLHELVPETPLRHGHAISIDMAFSATLANSRGLLSDEEHRRLLNLFSRAGLSMDHELFNEKVLEDATKAILKTRDGLLRAVVPHPLGDCVFLNDVSKEEMNAALRRHKEIMKSYPRNGEGLEAYVDASDTGYEEKEATDGAANGESNGDSAPVAAIKNVLANGQAMLNGNSVNGDKKDVPAANGISNGTGSGIINGANGHSRHFYTRPSC